MNNKLFTRRYPALLDYADDGISISFPDVPSCLSFAFSYDEAKKMAEEALELALHGTLICDVPNASEISHSLCKSQKVIYVEAKLEIRDGKLFSPNVIEF